MSANKDFATFFKAMRLELRPVFLSICNNENRLSGTELDQALIDLEQRKNKMITDYGYTVEEFEELYSNHDVDTKSEDPNEWVIKAKS